MNKILSVKLGSCTHHRYVPKLVDLVASGAFDPATMLTKREPVADTITAYRKFDERKAGWIKVELTPRS